MLHAFADGEDAPVIGLHRVGHDDAALAMHAGALREFDVGLDADSHDDEVGIDDAAVGEAHAGHLRLANNLLRLRRHLEFQAARFERRAQQTARSRIELPLHQRVHQMHDRDIHAAPQEAIRGLEAQQAAADDHGLLVFRGGVDHAVDIGNVAETSARPPACGRAPE